MNFNFGEILTRAWQIIWKHKILWVFGILASCGRGGGSSSGGGGGGGGGGGNGFSNGPSQFQQLESMMTQFGDWLSKNPWVILLFVLIGIVIVILSIYLGTIGRIGLIKGTYQAEQGAESLVFGQLFTESAPYFWRVFGLSFLVGLVFVLLLLPLVAVGVLTAGIGFVCLLPLICLLVPLGLVVNIIIEQANAAMVLENLGISDGFRRGWNIVKANVGPVLVMAIILGLISFFVGIVIALPIIIAVFPLVFGIANGARNWLWIAGICCAIYLPILLVLSGILTSFVQSAWTLTYMRLAKPQEDAPVIIEANA
jgi:membrane-anchored glycerophosphoryl diester phosphodiesterase (GDPDase)